MGEDVLVISISSRSMKDYSGPAPLRLAPCLRVDDGGQVRRACDAWALDALGGQDGLRLLGDVHAHKHSIGRYRAVLEQVWDVELAEQRGVEGILGTCVNVRVSERKNGDDVVSALNRESLAIQRQKRYGTFTTRETVLPVALPSAL